MPCDWRDSARKLFGESPECVGQILRDLLKVDLPPAVQYTALMPLCGDDTCGDDTCGGAGSSGQPVPEMVILAGPPGDPVRAIVVDFPPGRDDAMRRRWPRYAATVWLAHGCPVDLLLICPDELTAHWADRPIATALDGYVCRPAVLLSEDLASIFG